LLRAQEAPAAVAGLTSLATEAGAQVIDLTVQPASLEDVFHAVTGRGLAG
jgi:hypothetical protein